MSAPNERDEDDLDESLDLKNAESSHGCRGGRRSNPTEDRELNEHFEPEDDDKDATDYEAEGPEEYGIDPD
jgi:hypothetical protein